MWDKCFTGASAPRELSPLLDIRILVDCSNIFKKAFLPSSVPVLLQTLSKYFFFSVQLYYRCCQFKQFSCVNWFGSSGESVR